MVKKGQDPTTRFPYQTEKEEREKEETEKSSEELFDDFKDEINSKILGIFLRTAYESLLTARREMEEEESAETVGSSEVIIPKEEIPCFEKQIIKLMQLMNLESPGNRESRLTGLQKIVRGSECDQESNLKNIFKTAASDTKSLFQKALNAESSSSSRKRGFPEPKDEVGSLGIRLTRGLIKLTLLRVCESDRRKQLLLRKWIFEKSYKKRSAVMYLFDFLLYKAEYFAECVNTEESNKENHSEEIIGDDLLRLLAKAICRLQLLAMSSLSQSDLTERALTATKSELIQCAEDVRLVEKNIDVLMKGRFLMLKHKARPTSEMKKNTETIFWTKLNVEMRKCWGVSFWEFLEATTLLESEVLDHHIVYALSKFFVFGFES